MTKRVIEIDRLIMRNIIFVEKILVQRIRSQMQRVKDTKSLVETLKIEKMDIAETEETMLGNIFILIQSHFFTE